MRVVANLENVLLNIHPPNLTLFFFFFSLVLSFLSFFETEKEKKKEQYATFPVFYFLL